MSSEIRRKVSVLVDSKEVFEKVAEIIGKPPQSGYQATIGYYFPLLGIFPCIASCVFCIGSARNAFNSRCLGFFLASKSRVTK